MKRSTLRKNSVGLLFVAILGFAVMLSACAPIKPRIVQITNPGAPQTVKIKILKEDLQGIKITSADISRELMAIVQGTGYRGEQIIHFQGELPGVTDHEVYGVRLKESSGALDITYYHGRKDTGGYAVSYTTTDTIAELPMSIKEEKEAYLVTVGFPNSLRVVPRRSFMGFEQEVYADPSFIERDIAKKIDAIKTLHFVRFIDLTGKIESKYSADATYANFVRLLHGGSQTKGVEKRNTFTMNYNKLPLSLSVAVAPYRAGSIVNYDCTVPYTIASSCSISRHDLDAIKRQIEKIVKD